MTTNERSAPALDAAERTMLEGWLDYHRATLAMKCAGLTDAQLREASVPPSEFTLLGLVRHLAENERGWFREVLAGEEVPPIYGTDEDPDGEFHPTEEDTWEEARTTWEAEIEVARANAAKFGLDGLSVGVGRAGKPFTLRWIYTHMIEEYARHNGHADLVRERIDGATGE
ncbi:MULTISPECIES: DinB family protein [Streptomyces]|uniref:DinB family protein n=1 Tax=Streptomyces glycanivorans TaxID=3033808 RepID=A0ABY9JN41_9ACTN|nr:MULTISPECIES: DinB family protein [unclassified Streptomyces]TXS10560.1 DinB family protein [Streptomyces sp. wa22]WLQ67919.1 DinB family protein [Streptomyces sp. Alt3]WSQ88594.1 DinB family protein [Streptomyces sp. NBC_01212]WSR05400.1 DinB family protein [Streptomyces sp. NBC_01208]WSR51990.1 DinB family protein [Streptomyces sp. NBC_01201]